MAKGHVFRFRCSDYEREMISLVTESQKGEGMLLLSESDVVRIAIMELAKKHVPASKLADLKLKHGI